MEHCCIISSCKRFCAKRCGNRAQYGVNADNAEQLNVKGNIYAYLYAKFEYKDYFGELQEGDRLKTEMFFFDKEGRLYLHRRMAEENRNIRLEAISYEYDDNGSTKINKTHYTTMAYHQKHDFNECYEKLCTFDRSFEELPEYSAARGGMLNIFRLFVIQGGRLLSDRGVFCEIFPLAFTCDLSSAKLREHVFSNHRVLSIEAFPERDNPPKRVFASAKISVCILTYAKESQGDHKFKLRINREPFVEESKECSLYSLEHIKAIDSKNLTIPLTETEDSEILKKVYLNSYPFGNIGKCYTGEIDMTFCKKAFSTNPQDCKMLRGAHIDRYIERKEISQGETLFLNPHILRGIKSSLNETLFSTPRIIMQGITGVNERTRLKMTLVSNTFCANSVNYCLFETMDEAKFFLGLFNSRLLNYVFKLLSTNSNVNGYEVDNLPIANSVSEVDKQIIVETVTQILEDKKKDINYDTSEDEKKLDGIIYKLYGLNPQDIKVIESC